MKKRTTKKSKKNQLTFKLSRRTQAKRLGRGENTQAKRLGETKERNKEINRVSKTK